MNSPNFFPISANLNLTTPRSSLPSPQTETLSKQSVLTGKSSFIASDYCCVSLRLRSLRELNQHKNHPLRAPKQPAFTPAGP